MFARVLGAPQADRNLITFSLNAGLTFHEPFLHRDDDTFGIGMGYAKVSSAVAALDRATAFYNPGSFVPIARRRDLRRGHLPVSGRRRGGSSSRTSNTCSTPAAASPTRTRPPQRVSNELVLGLRTNILF